MNTVARMQEARAGLGARFLRLQGKGYGQLACPDVRTLFCHALRQQGKRRAGWRGPRLLARLLPRMQADDRALRGGAGDGAQILAAAGADPDLAATGGIG